MFYPTPYRITGRKMLYFNYGDPFTGERKLKSCKKLFMNSLTIHSRKTFENYSLKYLDYETNPRRQRLVAEGKLYSKRHVEGLILSITKYVYTDKFSQKKIGEINWGDIIDLLTRLLKNNPQKINTVNKVIKSVASIFSEAEYRGDLVRNPATRIGEVKYKIKERGFFLLSKYLTCLRIPKAGIPVLHTRCSCLLLLPAGGQARSSRLNGSK